MGNTCKPMAVLFQCMTKFTTNKKKKKKRICLQYNTGSIPGSVRSSGEGNVNPLQYSCLGNPMVREAWQAIVNGCREPARETPPVTRSGFKELACKGVRTSGTAPHAKASGPPGVSQDRSTIHSQALVLSSSDAWRSSMFPKN